MRLRCPSLLLRRWVLGWRVARGRSQRKRHVGKEFVVPNGRWSGCDAGGVARRWHRCRPASTRNTWARNIADCGGGCRSVDGENRRCFGLCHGIMSCLGPCRRAVRSRRLGWRDLGLFLRGSAGGPPGCGCGHGRSIKSFGILKLGARFGDCGHLGRCATKPHIWERGDRLSGLLARQRRPWQTSKSLLGRHFGGFQVDNHRRRWGNLLLLLWRGLPACSQLPEISLKDSFGKKLCEVSPYPIACAPKEYSQVHTLTRPGAR